ncbi:PadR family transcriptional regulator [Thermomonospora cellulosilytica]|uniref:DNA-binding PadR family transcriptional regulator n=1 Tax=Thermomonospora cellulosilytica TaxID=1411118 RepID=A0A7W3RAB0_9ACTN|nr:helix-turn-helix transcriptional regulator [Thermomonospora cellulosilytica]MBA9005534.1 DNA-binding PadR family transcriptional regulator [Thermomonospora cellulosilytica]
MRPDSLRGHIDALILAVLEDRALHGYAIMEELAKLSSGAIDLPTGTLYPALRRLERLGYLRSKWSVVGGRQRRTYQLTAAGRRALADERSAWQTFTSTIGAVLGPATPDRAADRT